MTRASGRRPAAAPGRVRIIAGQLRGSILDVPDCPGLRPTPNRLRETLFNWLQAYLPGARCLDLFAGSGALGIEALSRGAGHVELVERDSGLAAALRANLARLHQSERAHVHAGDALTMLGAAPAAPFGIVFVDPPFAGGLWDAVATCLEVNAWLAPHAWIYLEMPADSRATVSASWRLEREARVGDVLGMLYQSGADPLN